MAKTKGSKNKQYDTYYVYRMYERSNEYGFPYIGTTHDLVNRAINHKCYLKKRGMTLSYVPELHVIATFDNKLDAVTYENQLRDLLGWGIEFGVNGKVYNEDMKIRMRKPKSEEARLNMFKTPETRKRMSELKDYKKIQIKQFLIDGTFVNVYESISEASKITGVNTGNISKCLSGKINRAGKYIWKYAETSPEQTRANQKSSQL
jgi:predicted GIY-YIG superfamily endonuclease